MRGVCFGSVRGRLPWAVICFLRWCGWRGLGMGYVEKYYKHLVLVRYDDCHYEND